MISPYVQNGTEEPKPIISINIGFLNQILQMLETVASA